MSSGGDGIGGAQKRDLALRTHGLCNHSQQAVWGWRQLPVPVIAAVHGVAFGGGFQVALGADMRFLAPDTRMSVMEIKWGLVPDMAGTPILASLVRDDILRDLTLHRPHLLGAGSAELRPRHAHLRRSARRGARDGARDRRQEPRCDPRRQAHAQQSCGRSRSGAARRIRRADETDGWTEPDPKPCAREYREACAEICGLARDILSRHCEP